MLNIFVILCVDLIMIAIHIHSLSAFFSHSALATPPTGSVFYFIFFLLQFMFFMLSFRVWPVQSGIKVSCAMRRSFRLALLICAQTANTTLFPRPLTKNTFCWHRIRKHCKQTERIINIMIIAIWPPIQVPTKKKENTFYYIV